MTAISAHAAQARTLAAGSDHACAVTATGVVRCWGNNYYGQLGDGTLEPRLGPTAVVALEPGVRSVSAADRHTCVVTASGGAKCWGYNGYGVLGDGTADDRAVPTQVTGLTAGVAAIEVGGHHACALMNAGGVKCWGQNAYGQLGDGSTTQRLTPVDVVGLGSGVLAIRLGSDHTCALLTGGEAKCWGSNRDGLLGDGTTTARSIPVTVTGLGSGVMAISAGWNSTCAVIAGAARCWGGGQLVPLGVPGLDADVVAAIDGSGHQCVLLGSGVVKCWGGNAYGQIGDGTTTSRSLPVPVVGLAGRIVEMASTHLSTCAKVDTGVIQCWGDSTYGQLGDGSSLRHATPVAVAAAGAQFAQIAAGSHHTCGRTRIGDVLCWGENSSSQLGDGTSQSRPLPVAVLGLDEPVVDVAVGYASSCAVTVSGRAKCWGLRDRTVFPVPTPVPGLAQDIVQVAVGAHACARGHGGGLKCWGVNNAGQLGDGTTTDRFVAADVSGLSEGVASVVTGTSYTCALTTAGAVKCWGRNDYGQLGDGSTTSRLVPVDVSGLASGVAAISAGADHTCALLNTGSMKCWGGNSSGQLGDGWSAPRLSPVDVQLSGEQVKAIATGLWYSCAVTLGGTTKCWGSNFLGQLGDGSYLQRMTPQRDVVGLHSGVIGISAGSDYACAMTEDGAAKCWGYNFFGQFGSGETRPLTPRTVIGFPFADALFGDGFDG